MDRKEICRRQMKWRCLNDCPLLHFECDGVRFTHESVWETMVLYYKDVKKEEFYLFLQVVEINSSSSTLYVAFLITICNLNVMQSILILKESRVRVQKAKEKKYSGIQNKCLSGKLGFIIRIFFFPRVHVVLLFLTRRSLPALSLLFCTM